jgi:hypothetical protein
MFAMAIIAIAIFAIMSMIITSMSTNESAREMQVAKEAVGTKIEELKAKGFSALSTAYPSSANPYSLASTVSELTSPSTSQPGAPMTVTIDASNPDVYDLVVRVDWKGRNGKTTYSMRSLCAR